MHAAGLEPDAFDLKADMDDFSGFQPGLAQCFEVRPHPAKGLRVLFRRELLECTAYLRQNPLLAPVVEELDYVKFRLENAKYPIPTPEGPVIYLGRVQDGDSPAATLADETIVLMKRGYDAGYFCQTTYSSFPMRVHWGAVIIHELTHAWYVRNWLLHHTFWGLSTWGPSLRGPSLRIQKKDIPVFRAESNQEAVAAENAWWQAGKTGIRRIYHDQTRGCYAPLGRL